MRKLAQGITNTTCTHNTHCVVKQLYYATSKWSNARATTHFWCIPAYHTFSLTSLSGLNLITLPQTTCFTYFRLNGLPYPSHLSINLKKKKKSFIMKPQEKLQILLGKIKIKKLLLVHDAVTFFVVVKYTSHYNHSFRDLAIAVNVLWQQFSRHPLSS